MANNDNDKGILLETGTNEFEIVEFSVGPVHYGINVAKVREVINPVEVTKMPNAHPAVDGVFTLRGRVMPLVNLARVLGFGDTGNTHKIVVSEMNNVYAGFLVDEVSRIHRISWTVMEPPPSIANSDLVVGVIKLENRMVLLLDFERIIADISPEMNMRLRETPPKTAGIEAKRNQKSILLAEDSKMLRELLVETLHGAGYLNVTASDNGKDAWDKLEELLKKGPMEQQVQLIITDIEMPQMDGLHLTKRIKEHEKMQHIPVIIFSSLINEENRRKGDAVGADAQVSKPEIGQLIDLIDKKIL